MSRFLTITLQPDWRNALREAGQQVAQGLAKGGSYQGETLNFESPGAFLDSFTVSRWALIRVLQTDGGNEELSELSRRLGRDIRKVREDAALLLDLGLLEQSHAGALRAPMPISISICT